MQRLSPGRSLLLAILACTLPLSACDRNSTTGPDGGSAGPGQLEGTVALVKTGEPVPNALVALLQGGRVVGTAASDASGKFSFSGIPAGNYTVHLTGLELTPVSLLHTSFEPITQDVTVSDTPAQVYFGGEGVVPAQVTGTVSCHGAVAPGAQLRIVGGEVDTTVVATNEGRYASGSLGAGSYAVMLLQAPGGCSYAPPFQVARVRVGQLVRLDFVSGG